MITDLTTNTVYPITPQATLSTELGTYKQNYTTLETELEILRKQDAENRELLKKTSSQLQRNTSELGTTKETLAGEISGCDFWCGFLLLWFPLSAFCL